MRHVLSNFSKDVRALQGERRVDLRLKFRESRQDVVEFWLRAIEVPCPNHFFVINPQVISDNIVYRNEA